MTDQPDSTRSGDEVPIEKQPDDSKALPTSDAPPREGEEYSGEDYGSEERFIFTPPIDIYETDEGLVLHADLPGVSLETLDLQVQDNKLTLFGRVSPPAPPEAQLTHCEYRVGDFLRSFILSDEVDHDRIRATLNNGVLRVVLPKARKSEPRRIQVQTD
ncbi:Hsp20/alpha crystallin family protein [Thalassoroseus pseudoceratinae]|uniref:Hsp20/alpha crystallin family protein n=1 Tax=Thalassoroseus pseudoceratinae TaxID=2713176 RepID=UPI00141FCEF1|nr:Hsp20/alpha crystallin family protein [Thalassoroseus pseudoceratinae]